MVKLCRVFASQQDDKGEGPGREQGERKSSAYLVRGQVPFLNDVTGNAKIAHGTGKSYQYDGDGIQTDFGGLEKSGQNDRDDELQDKTGITLTKGKQDGLSDLAHRRLLRKFGGYGAGRDAV